MAEIAVELEIARLDAGLGQAPDDIGRDLRREQRVGAAQDVRHRMYSTLALILTKSGLVSKPSNARRRMISELASHLAAQFAACSPIAAPRAAKSGKRGPRARC
jgi:hypothetical protein